MIDHVTDFNLLAWIASQSFGLNLIERPKPEHYQQDVWIGFRCLLQPNGNQSTWPN